MKKLIVMYEAKYFNTVEENIIFSDGKIIRKNSNEDISLEDFLKKLQIRGKNEQFKMDIMKRDHIELNPWGK